MKHILESENDQSQNYGFLELLMQIASTFLQTHLKTRKGGWVIGKIPAGLSSFKAGLDNLGLKRVRRHSCSGLPRRNPGPVFGSVFTTPFVSVSFLFPPHSTEPPTGWQMRLSGSCGFWPSSLGRANRMQVSHLKPLTAFSDSLCSRVNLFLPILTLLAEFPCASAWNFFSPHFFFSSLWQFHSLANAYSVSSLVQFISIGLQSFLQEMSCQAPLPGLLNQVSSFKFNSLNVYRSIVDSQRTF